MFKLIKYDNANALEATWLRELTPERFIQEEIVPEVMGADGNVIEPSRVIEAQIIPATYEHIASIAYADTQMDLLRAGVSKYGGEIAPFEALIADVEANMQPYVPPVKSLAEQAEEVRYALQASIDEKAKSFGFSGGNAIMLYAGFVNPFQPLAQVFATWEASVWVEADAYKSDVIAGLKPMLSGAEAVALMPIYPA